MHTWRQGGGPETPAPERAPQGCEVSPDTTGRLGIPELNLSSFVSVGDTQTGARRSSGDCRRRVSLLQAAAARGTSSTPNWDPSPSALPVWAFFSLFFLLFILLQSLLRLAHTKPALKACFVLLTSPAPLEVVTQHPTWRHSQRCCHNCLLTGDLANWVRPFSKSKKVVKRWNPGTRAPTPIMSSQQSGQALGMNEPPRPSPDLGALTGRNDISAVSLTPESFLQTHDEEFSVQSPKPQSIVLH